MIYVTGDKKKCDCSIQPLDYPPKWKLEEKIKCYSTF